MKPLMIFFMIIALSCSVFAQTAEKPDSAKITRDNQIKESLVALGAYVSKYNVDSTETDSSSVAGHKSWGDVANKALDMLSGAVSEIVGTLEKAAPYVMTIMVRQQYAKAVAEVIAPLGFLIFVFVYSWYANKKWKPADDERVEDMFGSDSSAFTWRIFFCRFLPLVGGLFSAGFLISGIQNALLYGMNPYYYAIRDTLVLLLGSSHGM